MRPSAEIDVIAPEELAPGYYADNVRVVLDTVAARYRDLLRDDELALRDAFLDLSDDARRLWVRLVSRKGPLFRRDRLRYDEIDDLDAAADGLRACGLLDDGAEASAAELLRLLVRAEVAQLAAEATGVAPPRTAKRAELVSILVDALTPDELALRIRQRLVVLRPCGQARLLVYRLLFFGNLEQDWTELLLRDLGVVRYESYELRLEHRLFASRRAIDDTLAARAARLRLRHLLERGAHDEAIALGYEVSISSVDVDPVARPHVDRMLAKVGRLHERRGELEQALVLYEASPPARERRCRVLERLGRHEEALGLCRAMAAAPRDAAEADAAPKIEHRLRRALGEKPPPRRRRRRAVDELELERADDTVERLALAHFETQGRRGLWSENWLWRALFGLAFWDLVFAPVPGAFQHPFQLGPLDLDGPGFRAARADAVARRLDAIRSGDGLLERLLATAEEKRGVANRLVPWHDELESSLRFAVERVPGAALATICERLVQDPGRHRRGLPDLFVEAPRSAGGFVLYEVKAPGDQLRPEQKAWLDHLAAHDVPARVLRVRWRDSSR
ncbi:MAG: VRR-NUC domain-containing protein [Acidobacteriota bacterium]